MYNTTNMAKKMSTFPHISVLNENFHWWMLCIRLGFYTQKYDRMRAHEQTRWRHARQPKLLVWSSYAILLNTIRSVIHQPYRYKHRMYMRIDSKYEIVLYIDIGCRFGNIDETDRRYSAHFCSAANAEFPPKCDRNQTIALRVGEPPSNTYVLTPTLSKRYGM